MCELNFASYSTKYQTSQVAQVIKNPPANAREVGSISGWRRYPGCPRKWQPTLIFLPAKSHGQRTLVGYCPWNSCRVTHDWAHVHTHTQSHNHIVLWLNCIKDRPHSAEMSMKRPRCPSPQLALSQLEPQGLPSAKKTPVVTPIKGYWKCCGKSPVPEYTCWLQNFWGNVCPGGLPWWL